jgi:predicted nucleic acid-binding protein
VRYLLDVNALIAFGLQEHIFHSRVSAWITGLESRGLPELATCSITELGFVRVLAYVAKYQFTVRDAQDLLLHLKARKSPRFTFLADDEDIYGLPDLVATAGQTTDGHLLQLAQAHGVALATLDQKIPGAYLIPA